MWWSPGGQAAHDVHDEAGPDHVPGAQAARPVADRVRPRGDRQHEGVTHTNLGKNIFILEFLVLSSSSSTTSNQSQKASPPWISKLYRASECEVDWVEAERHRHPGEDGDLKISILTFWSIQLEGLVKIWFYQDVCTGSVAGDLCHKCRDESDQKTQKNRIETLTKQR